MIEVGGCDWGWAISFPSSLGMSVYSHRAGLDLLTTLSTIRGQGWRISSPPLPSLLLSPSVLLLLRLLCTITNTWATTRVHAVHGHTITRTVCYDMCESDVKLKTTIDADFPTVWIMFLVFLSLVEISRHQAERHRAVGTSPVLRNKLCISLFLVFSQDQVTTRKMWNITSFIL